MNPFFHISMKPEIDKMEVAHKIAREQVQEIRREAERLNCSAKYVKINKGE